MRSIGIVLVAAALIGAASSDAYEAAVPAAPAKEGCFFTRNFESWKAAPDAKSILIRINMHRYFRLELSGSCPMLTWPDARLITVFRGSTTVCNALDWDLKVSPGPPPSIPVPCIVKNMRELTPDDVAAIPKKQLP